MIRQLFSELNLLVHIKVFTCVVDLLHVHVLYQVEIIRMPQRLFDQEFFDGAAFFKQLVC